ncbi:MAG TPA: preprotein translocase subunit SecG [Clostridiales bacterium]|nr:preprotein translocase subunit SecG [Clostridiales bacterium]HQK73329.1 preprotein translocase subunit SecG [Clostridiales bacterium]
MTYYEIILGVLLIISSLLITIVVLLQEGKNAGLSGAIAGGAETFFGKNKGRTIEQKLVKVTKFISIFFFVLVLAATLLLTFLKK